MPDIFKALSSIMAWVMFIGGLIMLASTLIVNAVAGNLYSVDSPPPIQFFLGLSVSTITFAAAAYAMKVRKMLE
jgi:uncharacterized membrane protein